MEEEAAAIVEALRKCRCYLTGKPFTLITSQHSVAFIFDKRKMSKIKDNKILRWCLEMTGYHYDIMYHPGGKEHIC